MEEKKTEPVGEEQQSAIHALEQSAAALDSSATVAAAPQAAAGAVRGESEKWGDLPFMFGSIICMALPELKEVYSRPRCDDWGEVMAPVASKYGWDVDSVIAGEFGVILSTGALFGLPTMLAIRARRAAAEAEASTTAPAA